MSSVHPISLYWHQSAASAANVLSLLYHGLCKKAGRGHAAYVAALGSLSVLLKYRGTTCTGGIEGFGRIGYLIWSHKKNHRNSGVPPQTLPNVKYDAPREVGDDRNWLYRPLKKWGLEQILDVNHSWVLGMCCFVCILTFKSGFTAWGPGFRIQEEGWQSFYNSNDQVIDHWLQRIAKNEYHYGHSTMYLQTSMSQCGHSIEKIHCMKHQTVDSKQ